MKKCLLLLAVALSGGVLPAGSKTFTPANGENAVRITVLPCDTKPFALDVYRAGEEKPQTIAITEQTHFFASKPGCLCLWSEDISYGEYCSRVKGKRPLPKSTFCEHAAVNVKASGWFGFDYALLPFVIPINGLYRSKYVLEHWEEWKRDFKLYKDHEFVFEFRYDAAADRLEGYLEGSYAGRAKGAGRLEKVVVRTDNQAKVAGSCFAFADNGLCRLPSIPVRSNPLLRANGASLTLDPKYKAKLPGLIDVWSPAASIDQGRHHATHPIRSLDADPQSRRTPWLTGPEYMQWTVPTAFYTSASVLCADIPQKGRVPTIGISMTRFGTASSGSRAQAFLSLEGAATNRNVKVVGELSYRDADGKRVKTPLYLARVKLNPFSILQYVNDLRVYGKNGNGGMMRVLPTVDDYLDIEFIGAGTWDDKPRSSVQIFGCSLEKLDYGVVMDQSVRGNLFERGSDKPETGVKVTASKDNAKGAVRYRIFDPFFKTLKTGEQAFSLAKKGETKRLSFDLDQPKVGWYGIDFTFVDAKGREVGVHEASYTILAKDDREAGCESPYAAWPLGEGYHGSDPDRYQQAVVMRKAGYRGSWQPPVTNENEFGWPLTKTSLGQNQTIKGAGHFLNPCWKCSEKQLQGWLDRAVAHFKDELKKYPSCRYIQLLHEQGGRDVAPCLYDPTKALKRGEYKGINGDWDVYYCTEYAKRMRKEFPNLKIFFGNGSVSSEKVADMVRRGFDLSLVDQLGIESKGFGTMPERSSHREATGCLWALRETGRYFGYDHLGLNACNEYVFRPERRIERTATCDQIMKMTDYALRDTLLSLAHGCGIISIGHLEDCNDQYYDTAWGCGGQCTFYPFSYPKRMYTALSVLTRVLDKATLKRVVPNGGNSTYFLEFARDRKLRDYAYAVWTPEFGTRLAVKFPAGAKVKSVDVWGVETACNTTLECTAGSTPLYFVSSLPVDSVRSLGAEPDKLGMEAYTKVRDTDLKSTYYDKNLETLLIFRSDYGTPKAPVGKWETTMVNDPVVGPALNAKLVKTEPAPSPLLWESGGMRFREPLCIPGGPDTPDIVVRVRGNGSFGRIGLPMNVWDRRTGKIVCGWRMWGNIFVTFDGWKMLRFSPPDDLLRPAATNLEFRVAGVMYGSARKALNPIEMADVTEDLRFAGVYTAPRLTAEAESESDKHGKRVMKRDVSDKDL